MTIKKGIHTTRAFEKKVLAQFSVNVGAKCGHGCLYCSTGAVLFRLRVFKQVGENPLEHGYGIVDPDIASKVGRDARHARKRGLIQLCTTVDAWSPEAQELNLGRRCLEAILTQPRWSVRILTKNTEVEKEFDFLEHYKDRVLIALTLTATEDKSWIMAEVEPNASLNVDRMRALRQEHERGLQTYGMLCPLLPAIADSPEQIDELVGLALGGSEHTTGH